MEGDTLCKDLRAQHTVELFQLLSQQLPTFGLLTALAAGQVQLQRTVSGQIRQSLPAQLAQTAPLSAVMQAFTAQQQRFLSLPKGQQPLQPPLRTADGTGGTGAHAASAVRTAAPALHAAVRPDDFLRAQVLTGRAMTAADRVQTTAFVDDRMRERRQLPPGQSRQHAHGSLLLRLSPRIFQTAFSSTFYTGAISSYCSTSMTACPFTSNWTPSAGHSS